MLITYCIGDSLAKFGFVQACIDNINLSYHGSAQQLCTQGRSEILVRGLQVLSKLSSGNTMVSDFQGAVNLNKGGGASPPYQIFKGKWLLSCMQFVLHADLILFVMFCHFVSDRTF